jgi:mono/diheme cytochrome c family protein
MKYSKTICSALLFASAVMAFGQAASQPAPNKAAPYKVVDGYKVDADTLQGFRTWRSAACDRCHGANQEGLVGPSLINSLKTLSKDEFVQTVSKGRPNTQMIAFSGNAEVMKNMDQLYAYLKGRSDGAITKARVEAMQ